MGMIYKRGNKYWIKFYQDGKPYRESTKFTKEADARRFLKIREGEVAKDMFTDTNNITFDELAADFLDNYRDNGRKSLPVVEHRMKKLHEVFGGMKIVDITTDKINKYIRRRKEDKLENGSINVELAHLKTIFNLGAKATPPKVSRIPYFKKLKEDPPRQGFFEHEEQLKIREKLPDYLWPVFMTANCIAWRKMELVKLTWDKVDLNNRRIVLPAGTTKNGKARVISLPDEVYDIIAKQKEIRDRDYPECHYVFFNKGEMIKDFIGIFNAALVECGFNPRYKCRDCKKHTEFAKEPTKEERICSHCGKHDLRRDSRVFHDTRRTGVRGLIRSGVSETVAMKISGHLTRSVFQRYDITNEADLENAAKKVNEYHRKQTAAIKRRKNPPRR